MPAADPTRATLAAPPSALAGIQPLLFIVLLAAALRIGLALTAVCIAPDGALFIEYAQRLARHPVDAMRSYDQHPLYPAALLAVHTLIQPFLTAGHDAWIAAGRIVSILSSVAAILAIAWLGRRLYDNSRALIAATLLAILPDACQLGAEVLSDSLHLALYLLSIAALVDALHTPTIRALLICSLASALAFLTRPEGAEPLLLALLAVGFIPAWSWRRRGAAFVALLAVFFAVAGPYQLATGKLIPKKSLSELLQFASAPAPHAPPMPVTPTAARQPDSTPSRDPTSFPTTFALAHLPVPLEVLYQWLRAGRVIYVLLAILALVAARPSPRGGRLLAAAAALHLLVLSALKSSYDYLDRRHALVLAALCLPLAAAAIAWLADQLAIRIRQPAGAPHPRLVAGIVLICGLLTAPWLFRPLGGDDAHIVNAARWLAEHSAESDTLLGDRRMHRVALYADRPFAEWGWWRGSVKRLAADLDRLRPSFFAVDVAHMTDPALNPDFFADLDRLLGQRLELVHAEPGRRPRRPSTELRIYRHNADSR
jgi:4-amino-4-deoxy-L-arabinose transferase-like glycosyltransferase